ncbi:MAG: CPCC family cysteine-rich protein [Nocardioides sp.]
MSLLRHARHAAEADASSCARGRLSDVHPCPCCGYKTLPQRAYYDVCPVCSWEDEGGEPWAYSGPNGETLVEAQQRFLARDIPHRFRPGRGRPPKRGEERDPDWRPVEVTDDVLARVKQAHGEWDRSFDAATEGMDQQADENLREYNEAHQLLTAEAAFLPHGAAPPERGARRQRPLRRIARLTNAAHRHLRADRGITPNNSIAAESRSR